MWFTEYLKSKLSRNELSESEKAELQKMQKEKIEIERKTKKDYEQKELEVNIEKQWAKLDLETLQYFVEQWVLTKKTLKDIKETNFLNEKIIKEMISKIDKIQEINNKKNILPSELLITENEYKQAIQNWEKRKQLLIKLDQSLTYLHQYSNKWDKFWLWLFTFFSLLDKNLIKIQENTIDIKNSLISIK